MEKILTFKVGSEKFCIDVFNIIGIDQKSKISAVPLSVKHHIGMMNLRGQIIPAIDLRILFHVNTDTNEKEQCYIFIEINEKKMACLVDTVFDVVECVYKDSSQSLHDQILTEQNNFVSQVLNIDNEIIFLLNSELLYKSIENKEISNAELKIAS